MFGGTERNVEVDCHLRVSDRPEGQRRGNKESQYVCVCAVESEVKAVSPQQREKEKEIVLNSRADPGCLVIPNGPKHCELQWD